MPALTLADAQAITAEALRKGRELGLKPLTVAVLDAGGHAVALVREDGASNLRPGIATGKASGALALGVRRTGSPKWLRIGRLSWVRCRGSARAGSSPQPAE